MGFTRGSIPYNKGISKYTEAEKAEKKLILNKDRHSIQANGRRVEQNKKKYAECRKKAIEILGGQCIVCSCSEYILLDIDHIYGVENRTQDSGISFFKSIIAGKDDVQLLCYRCHVAKHTTGYEVGRLKYFIQYEDVGYLTDEYNQKAKEKREFNSHKTVNRLTRKRKN